MSTVPSRFPEQCARIFVFRSKKYFIDILNSGGRTGERKVSTVPSRFPEQYAHIFVFRSKNISSISRFLEVSQVKGRCQRCHRGSLNSVQAFSFNCKKIFSSIFRFLVVSQVKGRCQRYLRGFLNSVRAFSFFGCKNFSSNSRFLELSR